MCAAVTDLCETLGCVQSVAPEDAADEGFDWIILPRHGRRPVRFLGRALLRADNRAGARAGGDMSHWSDVQIYEVHAGGYVTSVKHVSVADDRTAYQDAWKVEEGRQVIASLRTHDIEAAWPYAAMPESPECVSWNALVGAIFGAEAGL
jgi:hypothetical protein